MCWSSRAIILRFNSKTQWQMFLLLYVRHVCVPQKDTNNLGDTLLQILNARRKNSRDLILGKVVYISIIYRISDSWLFSLNGYDFYFDHMTGENRELIKASDTLEHQPTVWPVPYACTQPYHPGTGSHGQLFDLARPPSAWHSRRAEIGLKALFNLPFTAEAGAKHPFSANLIQ